MRKFTNVYILILLSLLCSCASFYSKNNSNNDCTSVEKNIEVSSSFFFDDFVSKREFDYIPKDSKDRSPWWDYYYKSFNLALEHIDGVREVKYVNVDDPITNNKRYHMKFYFNDNKTTFDQSMYWLNNLTLGIIPFHKNYRGRLKVDVINMQKKVISSHEFTQEYDYYRSILLFPIGIFYPRQHADLALRNDLVRKMANSLFCKQIKQQPSK